MLAEMGSQEPVRFTSCGTMADGGEPKYQIGG